MKILIAGATGLIGRAIVELSNKKGIAIHYLTTNRNKIISNENFKGYYWNPDKMEIDPDCFKGVSVIINLAGATISKRWTPRYRKQILSSRINAIRTLHKGLDNLDTKQINSFISASAIGIYPSSPCTYYVEEEQSTDPGFLGTVVKAWEKEVDTLNHFGFAIAKIRIGMVLSMDGGALPELSKTVKNYIGAPFGSGRQWQSWIHISDLARMFLFLSKKKMAGVYNGVSPNPVTNEKMLREISRKMNVPLFLPKIPKLVLQLILGRMSNLLIASHRVSSKKIAKEGFVFQYPNIANALAYFFTPPPQNSNSDTTANELSP